MRLINQLKKGDPRAFERLVHEHQHRVFGLCLRMLGNPQEAEDLAQEVFLTVFRAIKTFRAESQLSTWIYRITRNHCLNRIKFLKRRAHEKKQSIEDTPQSLLSAQQNTNQTRPDKLAESRQMERLVAQHIASLSEEHRELIILRDVEHLTYDQIQEITGLAQGTVKSRLHRARMELARRIAPYLANE